MTRIQGKYSQLVFILFAPIIIIAKTLRWTILKETTVDASIGHFFLRPIIEGKTSFSYLWSRSGEGEFSGTEGNALYIFQKFNWFDFRTYVEFEIAISFVFNIILLWILYDFCKRNNPLSKLQFVFILFTIGVLNIYTFVLSKEPVQMLFFLGFYFILRSNKSIKKKWFLSIIALIIVIVTTRTYFALMLMFTLVIRYSYDYIRRLCKGNFLFTMVTFFTFFGAVYLVFLLFCSVAKPDEFAELIRVRTREAEAVTDILTVLPTNNLVLFACNYIITGIRMLFPIELIRFGPKYFPFVAYQLLFSYAMLKALINKEKNGETKNIATYLYWGFFFCSATFEPDFGSWVRHESVAIPFALFAFEDTFNKKVWMANQLGKLKRSTKLKHKTTHA